MSLKTRATCVFCCVKDETEVTGALSTKDDVTAHQNCLVPYCCHSSSVELSICRGEVKSSLRRHQFMGVRSMHLSFAVFIRHSKLLIPARWRQSGEELQLM